MVEPEGSRFGGRRFGSLRCGGFANTVHGTRSGLGCSGSKRTEREMVGVVAFAGLCARSYRSRWHEHNSDGLLSRPVAKAEKEPESIAIGSALCQSCVRARDGQHNKHGDYSVRIQCIVWRIINREWCSFRDPRLEAPPNTTNRCTVTELFP